MKTPRRQFLKSTAVGAGGLLLGQGVRAAVQPPLPPGPFERVALGRSGLKVTRIGMGTGMKGWLRQSNQTRLGTDAFAALLRGAYERGVRFFDLADLYGTHQQFGRFLRDVPRDEVVVATKIWWAPGGLPEEQRPAADVVVRRFLEELGVEHIDLVLLHCVTAPDWPTTLAPSMELLEGLREQGLIRAHGVSCHSLAALEAAAGCEWVHSVHTRINPYGVKMDGPAEKVAPVLKKVHAAGKGVVGMKLVGEGAFRDSDEKRSHAVRWVTGLGCVDTMIVGFEKPEEIDDFAARVEAARRPQHEN